MPSCSMVSCSSCCFFPCVGKGGVRGSGLAAPAPGDKGTTPHLPDTAAAPCASATQRSTGPGAPGACGGLASPLLPAWLYLRAGSQLGVRAPPAPAAHASSPPGPASAQPTAFPPPLAATHRPPAAPSPGRRLRGPWGSSALTLLSPVRGLPLHGGHRTGRWRVLSKLLPSSTEVLPQMLPCLQSSPLYTHRGAHVTGPR